jgi:hypothetical protein
MKIIYTPRDGERQEFTFQPDDLSQRDAEAIEDVGGDTWDNFEDFGAKFMRDNRKAYRAALWVLMRRDNPKLRFSDLEDVKVSEIQAGFDDDEQARIRESLEADETISDDERANALMALGGGPLAEVPDVAAADVGEGKDEGSVTAIAS